MALMLHRIKGAAGGPVKKGPAAMPALLPIARHRMIDATNDQ